MLEVILSLSMSHSILKRTNIVSSSLRPNIMSLTMKNSIFKVSFVLGSFREIHFALTIYDKIPLVKVLYMNSSLVLYAIGLYDHFDSFHVFVSDLISIFVLKPIYLILISFIILNVCQYACCRKSLFPVSIESNRSAFVKELSITTSHIVIKVSIIYVLVITNNQSTSPICLQVLNFSCIKNRRGIGLQYNIFVIWVQPYLIIFQVPLYFISLSTAHCQNLSCFWLL